MKKITLSILTVLAVVLASYASDEHLIILHTNDTHSQIDPDFDGKGGILRRKVAIDSIRACNKNVLLIDAGDAVQGTVYFNLFGGKVELAMLDSLGYDLVTLGNHEFDNGLDSLATFYRQLHATPISSNYDLRANRMNGLFKKYVIKEYDGHKIGFIAANVSPAGLIQDEKVDGTVYLNPMTLMDSLAGVLKKDMGVEYVVMISHLGYSSNNPKKHTDVTVARNSHNIDVIIGGHSHTVIDPAKDDESKYLIPNADGRNVLVAQTGSSGKNLGMVDVDLNTLSAVSKLIPINKSYDAKISASLKKFLTPYSEKVDSLMNLPIAKSAKNMPNRELGALNNWVADAAMDMATNFYDGHIDFAIMNKGGVRRTMPEGVVSEGLIRAMFPFDNILVVLKLSGKDVIEAFNVMANRNGDSVSKQIEAVYDKNKKLKYVKLNGKKIKKNKVYTVLTLDYLAKGGDYMSMFVGKRWEAKDDGRFGDKMLDYVRDLGANGIVIDASDEPRMYMK